jgi:hypothetical protein
MISESEYFLWLLELGIKENVLENASFYDKGYAFFRYCIDSSIDDDNIANLVKYMIKNDIRDSRDIDSDMWNDFMNEYKLDKSEVRDLLEFADDCLWMPDLVDYISDLNNITICGGGINECLKEVEIALKALDKPYKTESKFIY